MHLANDIPKVEFDSDFGDFERSGNLLVHQPGQHQFRGASLSSFQ